MGVGVSLSLPRNGFPVANHFVVSDPFSREHGFSVGFKLPVVSLSLPRKGVPFVNHPYSMVSVSFTRDHVFSSGNKVPDLRAVIGAGACVPKWSGVAPCTNCRNHLCQACFQSDLRWAADGYPPASTVG